MTNGKCKEMALLTSQPGEGSTGEWYPVRGEFINSGSHGELGGQSRRKNSTKSLGQLITY